MRKQTAYLIAIFTMIFWGTAFPFSKKIVDLPMHPIPFLALRMSAAFVVLFGYLLASHQVGAWWAVFRKKFWPLCALGLFLYNLSYVIQYIGVQYTTAINQTIISNTSTFFVVLINLAVFKRRPKPLFVVSMFVGFIGIVLIMLNDQFQISMDTLGGDLLTLLAFFMWAFYVVLTKALSTEENPLYITVSVFFWTCLFLIPSAFAFDFVPQMATLTGGDWAIILYLGIVCSGLATLAYTTALSHTQIPSENLALIGFLLPVVGIITSVIVLGEALTWNMAVGSAIVLASVFLIESKEKEVKE